MPPPTGETRQLRVSCMTFMNIATGQSTRTGIQILVSTPNSEVNIPLMQIEQKIACTVGQVQTKQGSAAMSRCADGWHIKGLPGQIVAVA